MSEIEEYVRFVNNVTMIFTVIVPNNRGRRLVQTAKAIGTPDDMAVGFVVGINNGFNTCTVIEHKA